MARAGGILLVLVVIAGVSGGWFLDRNGVTGDRRQVCVDFTDAVGVYAGNTVSLLGVGVGKINNITPRDGGVRMILDVDRDVPLPADVGAVVIDNSIVTDRRVEFDRAYTKGPKLSKDECIPQSRTRTPRGISDTFTASNNLLEGILGTDVGNGSDDKVTNEIGELVDAVDKAAAGRGEQINGLMRDFVKLQGNAPETDAILRRLLENSETMTNQVNERWDEVETLIHTVNNAVLAFTYFSEEFRDGLGTAIDFLPPLSRFADQLGDRLIVILKNLGPWVTALAPHATSLADIVAKLPGLATATDQIFDKKTGALRVLWRPPSFDLGNSDLTGLCAALRRPQGCVKDSSDVGLVQLMLGGPR